MRPQHASRQRPFVAIGVVLGLLLLALAPAVSRLQAALDPLAWVPVCTSGGLVQALSQPDGKPMPNPADHARWGSDGAPLPAPSHAHAPAPNELGLTVAASGSTEHPCRSPAWVPTPPPWLQAQARAPPVA